MIYLLYKKNNNIVLNHSYCWILDYTTQQRYIKFNNYYLLSNIYQIFFKNNQFLLKYMGISEILRFTSIIQFYKNFYYVKKSLKLTGVGYKIESSEVGQILVLTIGYSYKLYIQLPVSVIYSINKEKNCINLSSYNYILITTIIAKLKKLHKIDPYKGKGFKLLGEIFSPKFYKK